MYFENYHSFCQNFWLNTEMYNPKNAMVKLEERTLKKCYGLEPIESLKGFENGMLLEYLEYTDDHCMKIILEEYSLSFCSYESYE